MPSPRKYDPSEPRIITLDSLGGAHSPTCSNLRAYLVCEAKARKKIDITPGPLGMTATGLPQQSNYCDCGVFVLGYVKKFLQDPDTFVRSILQRDADRIKDWPEMDASKMRQSIRVLIFQLHAEQTQRENEQREAKSKAKKALKTKINVQRRLLFLECESNTTQ
jgi:sentrin-specific protease 7